MSVTKRPLHAKIFYGLLVGVAAGLTVNLSAGGGNPSVIWIVRQITEPIGQLFLRLLLMIVVPLVFSSLVVGVAGIGSLRTLGRVGLKSFVYTFVISAISVVIGLTLANTIKPGSRVDQSTAKALEERYGSEASRRMGAVSKSSDESPLMQAVKTIVPSNPLSAIASETPNMLHLMFFALALGIAATLVPAGLAGPFVGAMDALFALSAKLIDLIMRFAPFAVGCLLFNNLAQFGVDLLAALGWFILTVLLGLSLHMFGVYSLSVYFLSRLNPIDFFRRIKTVMLTAFSTSSSNATLPTALAETERNLGVPREINNFVLTIGATANQNGTALYEGGDRSVPGPAIRSRSECRAADRRRLPGYPWWNRNRRRTFRIDTVHHCRFVDHRREPCADRSYPGRGSNPGHVPHYPQRHRGYHRSHLRCPLGRSYAYTGKGPLRRSRIKRVSLSPLGKRSKVAPAG